MLRSSCLAILLLLTGSGAVSTVDAATAQELSSSGHAKMVALLAEIGRTKSAPAPTETEAQPDEGEYTSRLLAAKRRARGEAEEESGDSADG